jgi:hypothetical protein
MLNNDIVRRLSSHRQNLSVVFLFNTKEIKTNDYRK